MTQVDLPLYNCSSIKHRLYRIGWSVVTNRRWFEQGDQAADWTAPVGIVHRSVVHLSEFQTRNTLPIVDVNSCWLFGDHWTSAHGIPIRFSGTDRFESTSQTMAFGSFTLTDTSKEPLPFHSTELIGQWFELWKGEEILERWRDFQKNARQPTFEE